MASNHSFRWQAHWDKILFILASLYCLTVLGWLVGQNNLKIPFISAQVPQESVDSLSEDDKAFIAYLQARLATIEATQLEKAVSPSASSATLQGNLPPVAVSPPPQPLIPPNPPQPQPSPPSVVERVYIPLYPDIPQREVAPSPLPAPPALTMDSVPTVTPSADLLPSEMALSPSSENKLVGTLPSGDRSYAIFVLEGKPQHLRIGQWVGQTGWMLVNVEDQEITLQKNGQQRKMSVGSQLF